MTVFESRRRRARARHARRAVLQELAARRRLYPAAVDVSSRCWARARHGELPILLTEEPR